MNESQQTPTPSPDNLDLWFLSIFTEIDLVRATIAKKEGFIFEKHTYSEEEVLSSPAMKKIEAMVAQIGNVFEGWVSSSAISDERRKFYWDSRLMVERKLGEVRALIIERRPTFWERLLNTITRFIKFVMTHLPMLPEYIMKRIGLDPNPLQKRVGRIIDIDPDDV